VLAASVRKASGKGECDYGGVGGIRQAIGMRLRSIHRGEYEAGDKAIRAQVERHVEGQVSQSVQPASSHVVYRASSATGVPDTPMVECTRG
ncbi:hypothetical protein FRC06_007120, partial [Ceratobasidium sp. 370]